MAPTQGICTSFKLELLKAVHNFTTSTGHTFWLALVTNASTISASTVNYAAISSEVATGGGYTQPGLALTIPASLPTTSGTTAFADFDDALWSSSTITARGGLLYNTTAASDPAVAVLDFGSDKASTAGDFRVIWPNPDASNAIIRIA
jgi:hypothetical protein